MDELQVRTNAELMTIATSMDYGKATRTSARTLLEQRGVTVDAGAFANPRVGRVPPRDRSTQRALLRVLQILVGFGLMAFAQYLRMRRH